MSVSDIVKQTAASVEPTKKKNTDKSTQTLGQTLEKNKIDTRTVKSDKKIEQKREHNKAKKELLNAVNNGAVKNYGFNLSNAITDLANIKDASDKTMETLPVLGGLFKAKNVAEKSTGNAITNMGEGALKSIEGTVDTLNDWSDAINNPLTYQGRKAVYGKKVAEKALKEDEKDQENFIKRNLTQELEDKTGFTDIKKDWEKDSLIKSDNLTGQFFQGLGAMSLASEASRLLGFSPKLTSLEGLTGFQKAAAIAGNVGKTYASQLPSNALLFGQSYGSGLEEALNEGATRNQARAYGLSDAAIEQVTEMMTGGVPGLEGKGGIDQYLEPLIGKTKNPYARAALKTLYSSLGEGAEEYAADMLNPLAKKIYSDEPIDWDETRARARQSFLLGSLTGSILNGPQSLNNFQEARIENQINKISALNDVERGALTDITLKQRRGEPLSQEDMSTLQFLNQKATAVQQQNNNLEQRQQAIQNELQQIQQTQAPQTQTQPVQAETRQTNTNNQQITNAPVEGQNTANEEALDLPFADEETTPKYDRFANLDNKDKQLAQKLFEKQQRQEKLTPKEREQMEYLRRKHNNVKFPELTKADKVSKSEYAKYYANANMDNFDNSMLNKAKEVVTANKQGKRTKQQWLDVANNIGTQASNMDAESLKRYAYESFKEARPNIGENLNKQGQKYVGFDIQEWINAVYDGAGVGRKAQKTNNVEFSKQNVDRFNNQVETSLENKKSQGTTKLGRINKKLIGKIKSLLGIDVTNRIHTITNNDIRHMLNEHGNPEIEAQKGQIAIDKNDIKRIPNIIENPTDIVKGTDHKLGQTIRYIKKDNSNTTYVVEVVPDDSNSLIIKTMWKKPSTLDNSISTPISTSETQGSDISSTFAESISRNAENVNKQSLQEQVPTRKRFVYEASDNSKIDNLRKSVSQFMDNSKKTRSLVSTIEKVIQDKNYNIIFDDTIGDNVNGKISIENGEVSIKLNPNSNRLGEFVLTHEITHAIDTQQMRDLVMNFAKKDAKFNEALQSLKETYGTEDISDEVLADVSGQLFGNQEFISSLKTTKPSIFKRLYNKIISLANKITGNSNEALFIKDLRNKWETAYREADINRAKENITSEKYSILGVKSIDKALKSKYLSEEQQYILNQVKSNYEVAIKSSKTNEQIREETGWYKDKNGDWKFEITDKYSKIKKKPVENTVYKLEELLDHKLLYDLEPRLRNIKVKFEQKGNSNGSYKDGLLFKTIKLNNDLINEGNESIKKTLLHEIQHYNQHRNGFETGSTSGSTLQDMVDYVNSLGEIEASDAQERMNLSQKELQKIAPESSKDNPVHPKANQLIQKRINQLANKQNNKYNSKKGSVSFEEKVLQDLSENKNENIDNDLWRRTKDNKGLDNSSFSIEKNIGIDKKADNKFSNANDLTGFKTGYENVSNNLLGFSQSSINNKQYNESKYKYNLDLMISFDGGKTYFEDSIKGMNRNQAIERAKRNWGSDAIIKEANNKSNITSDNEGRKLSKAQQERYKDVSDKLRDENGNIKVYHHGTNRADRVGYYFDPARATSGPMAFFTDNAEIAKGYSESKQDTSLSREYDSEYDLFKANNQSLDDYWNSLSKAQQDKINETGYDIGLDEDFENAIHEKGASRNSFGDQYKYYLQQENNNGLKALYNLFIQDGNFLFEDMHKFQDVLKMAGAENVEYLDPYKVDAKVYDVYLNIKNPFDTTEISQEMVNKLKKASKTATVEESYSADMWDKSNRSPESWIEALEDDIKNGSTHAWTSIPDWVTDVLKENGYDGIVDLGGKGGGQGHQVAIPFYSNQIKGIDNLNPTDDSDIRYSWQDGKWQTYLEDKYKSNGTKTRLDDIRLPEGVATTSKQVSDNFNSAKEGKINNKKLRSWVNTSNEATNSQNTLSQADKNAITYEVQSNKKTAEMARKNVDGLTYEQKVFRAENKLNSNQKVTAVDLAEAQMALLEANERGDIKTYLNLQQDIAIMGTELGQAVQAMSMINKMSPDGQIAMLNKIVNRNQKLGNKTFDGVSLNEELVQKVLDSYDDNTHTTFNKEQMDQAVDELKQDIANQMKVSRTEKINAWRYLSMLGNPKTHIRNVVANVAMTVVKSSKDTLSAIGESAAQKAGLITQEQRTRTIKRASADVKALADVAYQETFQKTKDHKYNEMTELESKRQIFNNKVLEKVRKLNDMALSGEDQAFKKLNFKKSFSNYLTAQGITTAQDINNNPAIVEAAKAFALQEAKVATFNQENQFANKITSFDKMHPVARVVRGAIIPFARTPLNIAKTGIEYTPGLGFATTYADFKKAPTNMKGAVLIDGISKQITGSSLAILGYALAKSGILTGDSGDDKEDQFEKDQGAKMDYSIKIGDTSYDLSWLSPSAMPLFVGARMYEILDKQEGISEDIIIESLSSTLDPLSELSCIRGFTDVISSFTSGNGSQSMKKIANMGKKTVQNYISQFVPTVSSQFARVFDDTKRTTNADRGSGKTFTQETMRQLQYKIPGLRNMLPESTDYFGQDRKENENLLVRAFESFLSPANTKKDTMSKESKELVRLYKVTGNDDIIPSAMQKYINFNNNKYDMSSKEYNKFKKDYGEAFQSNLKDLMGTKEYKNASDDERAEMIAGIMKYSKDKSKDKYLTGQGEDYTRTTSSGEVSLYESAKVDSLTGNNFSIADYYIYKTTSPKVVDGNMQTVKNKMSMVGTFGIDPEVYSEYLENVGSFKGKNRKVQIYQYINSLPLSATQKAILFKQKYGSYKYADRQIYDYINNSDLTREEKYSLAKYLNLNVKE